ncbi:alkaline phosphatase family protein [bacterium]|nr:alkaline phosphatase family protein [bacterium]
MRTVLFFLTILLQTGACFAFLPLIGTKDVNSPENSTVILISMDGFRADYWDKVETPRFHELMKQGVLASNLQPVFPSVTFVNHYSIVTGLYAENHGIVNNSMWDPKTDRKFEISDTKEVNRSDWWQGEPIWVTAEKQGLKTASMFWVGSSAEIGGYRPSYWFNYDASLPRAKRVKQVLDWLDYPQDKRPGFITLYFEDVDEAGHSYGPDSGQVKLAIQNLDSSLGELWDGIKTRGLQEKVTILIVSDHGMAKVDRKNRIRLNDYVKKSEAKVVGKGALSLVWPNSQTDLETILSRVKKTVGPFIVLPKR